jgi:predicted dehydrogenase
MNFALLGDDPAVLPLVRAIARHQQHRIEVAAMIGPLERELLRSAPGVRVLPSWDRLLTAGNIDIVLVCGVAEATLEAAKQIAAAGMRLVIFPRSGQGSTWIYELGLIRDEGRTSLAPVFDDRLRPIFQVLHETIDSGALDRILYLQIDREIVAQPTDGGPPLLTRDQLEDALLHDVDLLRCLGGDYTRVSAVHSGKVADRIAAAGVTLLGDQLPEATWTARGSAAGPRWKLVVAGEKGEITVTAIGEPAQWSIDDPQRRMQSTTHEGIHNGTLIEREGFGDASQILQSIEGPTATTLRAAEWIDLVRAFEVVDAARSSVRRRRAIDLHLETTSERNIFKSQMTAVGCLLLTFTLLGVVFLLLVMPLFDVRSRMQIEADRANAIIRATDFAPATATVNSRGSKHLRELAARMEGNRFPILIAESKGPGGRQLSERRRDAVVAVLKEEGAKEVAERTQIGPVVGEWYPQVLQVVRILAFAPLALFLALQVLVFLTRPATK